MPLNAYEPAPEIRVTHPEWSRSATIYQINQRQFTPEGTFRAAEAHLPRLRDLGVDIVWIMPVNPIGEVNRKGPLGSPYAVKDYLAVNPEFGTLEDLRHFVATAHDLGLHVILDWVANHTAWDNHLVTEHPEWYARDWRGDFRPTPWWDWEDIIDLDFSQPGLREYMTEAMKYWVREADIDGFRCDVAGFVPVDFWDNVRRELDEIKPVFMLGEWEARDLHVGAFDMTYAWSWNETMHRIAKGVTDVEALKVYYAWNDRFYQRDAYRMLFVSNHDKNAWEGTEYEQFGDALEPAIVLSVVSEGMPLIYNGQEAGSDKRLAFFDKDEIEWRQDPQGELYRRLFALKKAHRALWNGSWGGRMVRVPNTDEKSVLSFVRAADGDRVFAAFNLSAAPQTVTLGDGPQVGVWVDAFDGTQVSLGRDDRMTLPAWGYRVLVGV
ncbi:alpha-amylase family glycosyl hydrolase [Intrasporangium mesophilum]